MLECKNSLVNMLYNMDYRGVPSAKRLYSGISPLFRSAPALRETALLVLRKLMHSCSEEARQVAVVGFLQILKHFRYYSSVTQGVSSSQSVISSSASAMSISSQATVDLHHNSSTNANRFPE
jgi:FANCI solenoid 2